MAASGAESDDFQEDLLNGVLALWALDTVTFDVQLFTTDVAVTNASVPTDFTLAVFPGGAAVNIAPGAFGAAVVAAHIASSTGPIVTWINGGGVAVNVWGYLVTDHATGDFKWGENFGAAQPIAAGGAFSVQVILKQQSAYF